MTCVFWKYTMYFAYSQRWIGGWYLELPPRVGRILIGAPYSRRTSAMVMPFFGRFMRCSCWTFMRRVSAWAVAGNSNGAAAKASVATIRLVAMYFMALVPPAHRAPMRLCSKTRLNAPEIAVTKKAAASGLFGHPVTFGKRCERRQVA